MVDEVHEAEKVAGQKRESAPALGLLSSAEADRLMAAQPLHQIEPLSVRTFPLDK